jgi:hypothetical protein
MRCLNGYVRMPTDHPHFNTPYGDIPVTVHGGLTYGVDHVRDYSIIGADYQPRTTERSLGWVGFDTAHAWDSWSDEELALGGYKTSPQEDMLKELLTTLRGSTDPRFDWTVQKLMDEVNSLAEQLALLQA